MARDSKIEKKNENRGIGMKWNVWDAHKSSFPCFFCVVAAGNRESVKNVCTVVIVEGTLPSSE